MSDYTIPPYSAAYVFGDKNDHGLEVVLDNGTAAVVLSV